MNKKLLSLALSFLMVFCFALTAFGEDASFIDMPADGNWAKEALTNAVENGLLSGYNSDEGQMLKPNGNLTRAELATIVNRAFGATAKADLKSVTDVASGSWYADEMAKAVKMGTFMQDAKMRPEDKITRQEAMTVIARAFKLSYDGNNYAALASFKDAGKVASYAKGSLCAMIERGYAAGDNGNINPTVNITRAQFAKLMNNMVKQYFNAAGEYTSVAANGNVMINVPGVTLKDVTINGDLIIGDGVGDGDVVLNNVKVTGNTVVRGGGENSIHIKGNSQIGNIIIQKAADGAVRIVTSDGAVVEAVFVDDGSDDVILTGSFEGVTVSGDVNVKAVDANIQTVTITAKGAALNVDKNTTINNVNVESSAAGSSLTVAGTVGTLSTDAKINIQNNGTISKAEINANGVTLDGNKPSALNVASSVTQGPADSSGNSVGGTSSPTDTTSGGSSGGGGGSSTKTVSGIIAAPLVDRTNDSNVNVAPADYAVKATKKSGESFNRVAITATDVPLHQNANHTEGYWVGALIAAPTGFDGWSGIKYNINTEAFAAAASDPEMTAADYTEGNTDYMSFYFDAANENEVFYVTLDWDGDATTYSPVKYRFDLTDVDWTALAPTSATAVTSENDNKGKYDVNLNKSTKTLNVSISKELNVYESSNPDQGFGQWVGILIDTGETLTNLSCKTTTSGGTGDSFVALTNDDIAEALAAGATAGSDSTLVWWVKAEEANGKSIYLKQNDVPDKAAIKLTIAINDPESSVSDVIKAPLCDQADTERNVTPSDYAVNAFKKTSESFNRVEITANDVLLHQNAEGNNGYWVGVAIAAPDNFTGWDGIEYNVSTDDFNDVSETTTDMKGPDFTDANGEYLSLYFNAGNGQNQYFITLDWDGSGNTYEPVHYLVALSDVTLKSVEPSIALVANDLNKGKYEVSLSNNTLAINVTKELEAYDSSNPDQGTGQWMGVLIDTGIPLEYVSYKTEVSGDFAELTQADIDEAQAAGAGEATDTLVWWVKAEDADAKPISLKQDGAPDNTAVTLTIALSGVDNDIDSIIAAPLCDQANTARDVANNYAVSATKSTIEDFNRIAITATDVLKHENGIGNDGFWVGAAIAAPANFTGWSDIRYSISTADFVAVDSDPGMEEPDYTDDNGEYISFYFDAANESDEFDVTLDWDGEGATYSPVQYLFDLSNVTTLATPPEMTELAVTFADDETPVTTTGSSLTCIQNQVVDSIVATMSEAVTVTPGAVVMMQGTDGDCATQIPSSVEYGTISLDPQDSTKVIITPNGSNGTAGYTGEMTFTVAAGALEDLYGEPNEVTTFTLTVKAGE